MQLNWGVFQDPAGALYFKIALRAERWYILLARLENTIAPGRRASDFASPVQVNYPPYYCMYNTRAVGKWLSTKQQKFLNNDFMLMSLSRGNAILFYKSTGYWF